MISKFTLNPLVRKKFFAMHKNLVRRLPPAKQALFHERTLHGMHKTMEFDPTGKKGMGTIIGARNLRVRRTGSYAPKVGNPHEHMSKIKEKMKNTVNPLRKKNGK